LEKTKGIDEIVQSLPTFYVKITKTRASDGKEETSFDVEMCKKVMTTYVILCIQRTSGVLLTVFSHDKRVITTEFIGHSLVNGKYVFHSGLFNYNLVDDGNYIYFNATTVRKDIRIDIRDDKVFFEKSKDSSNPAVVLGKGSFGFVIKVFGKDGRWYIVKVFSDKESAEHEWSALNIIKGKHECFQNGILLETDRCGDSPNIIVSEFQGDVVLSKCRESIYRLNLQQLIWMFMKLAEALKVLHSLGICHGDIKPDNLIISKDSNGHLILVLIDFGIAERIGNVVKPEECYTWWYRPPELSLDEFLREFKTEPIRMSGKMDYWAFFITFLHVVADKSVDFLGCRSKGEYAMRIILFNASPISVITGDLSPFVEKHHLTMDFVQKVFFALLNKEGSEKLAELYKSVGIELSEDYYPYILKKFHKKRNRVSMVRHVKKVFCHLKMTEVPKVDYSGPLEQIINLFKEILCHGGDLSLLGCLTMEIIDGWLERLKEYNASICSGRGAHIYFY
jgi:serine/threonine protein kinase